MENQSRIAEFRQQATAFRNEAEKLNSAAKSLEDAANALAGIDSVDESIESPTNGFFPPRTKKDGGLTRYGEIAKFLEKNGPSRRQEILDKAGVPEGSIRAILNLRNFDQDEDGNWKLKKGS